MIAPISFYSKDRPPGAVDPLVPWMLRRKVQKAAEVLATPPPSCQKFTEIAPSPVSKIETSSIQVCPEIPAQEMPIQGAPVEILEQIDPPLKPSIAPALPISLHRKVCLHITSHPFLYLGLVVLAIGLLWYFWKSRKKELEIQPAQVSQGSKMNVQVALTPAPVPTKKRPHLTFWLRPEPFIYHRFGWNPVVCSKSFSLGQGMLVQDRSIQASPYVSDRGTSSLPCLEAQSTQTPPSQQISTESIKRSLSAPPTRRLSPIQLPSGEKQSEPEARKPIVSPGVESRVLFNRTRSLPDPPRGESVTRYRRPVVEARYHLRHEIAQDRPGFSRILNTDVKIRNFLASPSVPASTYGFIQDPDRSMFVKTNKLRKLEEDFSRSIKR